MSLERLGLPRVSRSHGSESSLRAPSYSERAPSYQEPQTLALREQPTLDAPEKVEDLRFTDKLCRACSAGTDPVRQASCKLLHHGDDQRVWIEAHSDAHCCGHQHRTLVLCFDGTGDQFDDSVRRILRLLLDLSHVGYRTPTLSISCPC